ncbi:FecR family protein [Rhodopseudomonas sp. RCAM05734]|uniref:FecR family protein n=1 Tax=Rhodopseudomonas sp. RCAM05734 TaxID=3457549 RepID=UPI0040442D1A
MSDGRSDMDCVTPLELEAHAWVRRIVSREATAADARRLRQWCAQSAAHETAFRDARQLWKTFGAAALQVREDEVRAAKHRSARHYVSRRMVLGGALAASVAGVAIVRPPLRLWPSLAELEADFRTGTGEQRQIAIADVASVQMNTKTSLVMKGGDHDRSVELVAGEASFRVTADASSFNVLAADGRTHGAGGRFDVRLDDASVCVTCFSDQIEVTRNAKTVRLKQSERVIYDSRGLGEVAAVDPAIAGAWQDGLIICRNTPLSDFVNELNRYRPGRIVLFRSDIGRLSVSGRFNIVEPDQALTQIQKAFSLRVRNLPGGLALVG